MGAGFLQLTDNLLVFELCFCVHQYLHFFNRSSSFLVEPQMTRHVERSSSLLIISSNTTFKIWESRRFLSGRLNTIFSAFIAFSKAFCAISKIRSLTFAD